MTLLGLSERRELKKLIRDSSDAVRQVEKEMPASASESTRRLLAEAGEKLGRAKDLFSDVFEG